MEKNKLFNTVLVGACVCAMGALFFVQAKFALRPVPIAFERPELAYGYTNVAFTGTVYTDEGTTNIGANITVAMAVNGTAVGTDDTDSSGVFSITVASSIVAQDVLTFYLDGETQDAALVIKLNDTELSASPVTGMDLYQDRLIVRTESTNLNLTTTNLATADDVSDSDLNAVYFLSGTTLTLGQNKELFVWEETTHTASGTIYTHDVDVRGTLNIGAHTLYASGSVVSNGTFTTTGNVILQATSSGEILSVTGSSLTNLYFDQGILGYFNMDEGVGLNASGSTLNTATGGNLLNGAYWTAATTGSVLFFDPYAIELDGSNDYLSFGDNYDFVNQSARTFSLWMRRKGGTGTEDILFGKRAGTGASNVGYIAYFDDSDDALNFEVSDGTDEYNLRSTSTISDQSWHHIAITWDGRTQSGGKIYIDGTPDTIIRTGTFPNVGSIVNNAAFTVGANASGGGNFQGTIDDLRLYSKVLTGSQISYLADGNKDIGSGKYMMNSRLDVNGNFGIYSGKLSTNDRKNYRLFVSGDFTNHGRLLAHSGTVILDGTNQTVRGSTAFHHLAKTATVVRTITFQSNTQQTFSGSLSIYGAVNQKMNIRSTRTGSQSYLVLDGEVGAQTLQYLDVQDSNAMSGETLICTQGCVNSGNNYNWRFLGECGDGVLNTGEACDDGNSANTDSCLNTCVVNTCGDTYVDPSTEECEPPGVGSCLSNCFFRGGGGAGGGGGASASSAFSKRPPPPEGCGNSIYEPDKGEECDLGTRYNGLGTCSYDCKKLFCGDGTISPQIGEDCEPQVEGVNEDGETTYKVGTCGEICTAPEVLSKTTIAGGCRRVFLRPCQTSSAGIPPEESSVYVCGNGTKEGDEECDYGGTCVGGQFDGSFWTDAGSAQTCRDGGGTPRGDAGDGCSVTCKEEFCGDGVVQERGKDNIAGNDDDEQCDNGKVCSNNPVLACSKESDCGTDASCNYHQSKDYTCSSSCKRSVCGNGTKESGETCDDGNKEPGDGCNASCRREIAEVPVECGNGLQQEGEQCDDGNTADGDGCSATCQKQALCGNGKVEGGEECDGGSKNSDTKANACRTNCKKPVCGDGTVDKNEQCDTGQSNSDTAPNACRLSCKNASCGDGVVDEKEECDGGEFCTSGCRAISTRPMCGNSIREQGEECDDGNERPGDGCGSLCTLESLVAACGNGRLDEGEQCDDANLASGDGCSAVCRIEEEQKPAAPVLPEPEDRLDADIVIVNPTEIANALKFVNNTNPCAIMVRKGLDAEADTIRRLATIQNIPIVQDIPFAHVLYDTIAVNEYVTGLHCERLNALLTPEEKPAPGPASEPEPQKAPSQPTLTAYGFYNYAQLRPMISGKAPEGDTGPGAIAAIVAGSAAGVSWMRKRRRKLS